jgi:hypothetical protein
MKPSYTLILVGLALTTAAATLAQNGGTLSIQDMRQPQFRLSTSVPGILVVHPFTDIFPGKEIPGLFEQPYLRMTICPVGTQARSNVSGILRNDRWEFRLPKLHPETSYVAEFAVVGRLDPSMADEISKKMVRDSEVMNEILDWALFATNRLGPDERTPVPASDRLGPNDPVPENSAKQLHQTLDAALQERLPAGLTVTSLPQVDPNAMRKFRNLTIGARQNFQPIPPENLDAYASWLEGMIESAELTTNVVGIDFITGTGSNPAAADSETTAKTTDHARAGSAVTKQAPPRESKQPSPRPPTDQVGSNDVKTPKMPESTGRDGFTGLARTAGAIMSAAFAIVFAWRRRSPWEPSEQDVDKGAEKVAGLLTAVFMVFLWVRFAKPEYRNSLTNLAVVLGVLTVLSLIVYGYLVSNQTYFVLKDEQGRRVRRRNIIGGFRLTNYAAHESKPSEAGQPPVTLQEVLQKVDFKPDMVWPRSSRSTAKAVFVICYIFLVVCGSVALASAAVVASLAASETNQSPAPQDSSSPLTGSGESAVPRDLQISTVGPDQLLPSLQSLDVKNRSEASREKSIASVVRVSWQSPGNTNGGNTQKYCLRISALGDFAINGVASVNDSGVQPQTGLSPLKSNDGKSLGFELPVTSNEAYLFLRYQRSNTATNYAVDVRSLISAVPGPISNCSESMK